MKSQFIKSSVKVKADPRYYKLKADRWADQRNEMFAEVEQLEAEAGGETPESLALHAKAMALSAKVLWAGSRIPVAMEMQKQERLKVACCNCGESAGRYCFRDRSGNELLCFKRGRA